MRPPLTRLADSSNHGGGYVGHAIEEIASLFQGIRRVASVVPPSPPSNVVTRTLLRALAPRFSGGVAMERVLDRCAGLDVHKKTVTGPWPAGAVAD